MAEIFITLEEAAGLEEVGYDTIQKRLRRTRDDYKTNIITNNKGGRDVVTVALSSLSPKAKAAYAERVKLKKLAEKGSSDKAETVKEEKPWYIDCDVGWASSMASR